jgi:hypothetical protein
MNMLGLPNRQVEVQKRFSTAPVTGAQKGAVFFSLDFFKAGELIW